MDGDTAAKALAEGTIQPVSRHTLHGELVERLRDLIIEGQLAPGTRINEGSLSAKLGVSRTPMREAIKSVASEGLIALVPGRGAVIRKFTPEDVAEMLEVLRILEVAAGEAACQRASDGEIAAVVALHEEMMGFYASRDRLEYYKRNQAIHSAIARLSGNRFLADQHQAIQARLKRIRFIGNGEAEKWAGAVAEHAVMIAALQARDAAALKAALGAHLAASWLRVREIL